MKRFEDAGLPELPNRLSVADLNPDEVMQLIGGTLAQQQIASDNYNWLAAYLVEEVGLHEEEVPEWFRSSARGLDDQRPIEAWKQPDGYNTVFEYAQLFKAQVDENLGSDDRVETYREGIERAHRLGAGAIKVIAQAFEIAGIADAEWEDGRDYAVHNPEMGNALMASWRPGEFLNHFRIDRYFAQESRLSRFYVVFGQLDGKTEIFQCGIGEAITTPEKQEYEVGSDIDGRPPTAGQVASFVIPLANEVKNRSLELIRP